MKIFPAIAILFLSGLWPMKASAQLICFGPDMVTATMCIAQKTAAITTMLKLQRDPRAGTWASEGQAGVKFTKREEAAMKLAMACQDIITCTAANAKATEVANSIPSPVKGDLGDFAGQIWQGAELPKPGQGLDELFDGKDPNLQPLHNIAKTASVPQQTALAAGAANDRYARRGLGDAGNQALSGPSSSGIAEGARAAASAAKSAAAALAGPQVASDAGVRWEQQPTAIHFDSGDAAIDLSQAAAFALSGPREARDPDAIIGFGPSSGATAANLFGPEGVGEGEADLPAKAAVEAPQVAKAPVGGKQDDSNPLIDAKPKDTPSDQPKE